MPALNNNSTSVRSLATQAIVDIYKLKGSDLQNEVVASAQELKIKKATMDIVYEKIKLDQRKSTSPVR